MRVQIIYVHIETYFFWKSHSILRSVLSKRLNIHAPIVFWFRNIDSLASGVVLLKQSVPSRHCGLYDVISCWIPNSSSVQTDSNQLLINSSPLAFRECARISRSAMRRSKNRFVICEDKFLHVGRALACFEYWPFMKNTYWFPWRVKRNTSKLSIGTSLKGTLTENNCNAFYVCSHFCPIRSLQIGWFSERCH